MKRAKRFIMNRESLDNTFLKINEEKNIIITFIKNSICLLEALFIP